MSEPTDIVRQKRDLRSTMRARLLTASADALRDASERACLNVTQILTLDSDLAVMLYLPLQGELDCTPLVHYLLERGRQIAVPHVDWTSRSMQPVRLRDLEDANLVADHRGVRTPRHVEPVATSRLEAVIVPALAFDVRGCRLGRGGGFYDRFLADLPTRALTIGLAFETQVLEELPFESHDARVKWIATESRVFSCG